MNKFGNIYYFKKCLLWNTCIIKYNKLQQKLKQTKTK